jgi:hypothetical protein
MATSITYPDEFFTTTAANRLALIRQAQYRPYRLAQAFIDNAKMVDGGERVIIPFDVQEHSVTTQMTTGYEAVDMDVQTVLKPGTDTWFFAVSPIVFSWVDEAKNKGKAKHIDIIETRVKDTESRMRREFETQLLKGTQASMSDLNTLNGADNSGGFIEEDAIQSQGNTVHGLSKSTYSTLPGFQNQIASIANDFSAGGIAALQEMHIRVQEITEDPTKLRGFASIAGAINYNTAVQANERYITQRDAVRTGLMINGVEYQISSLMPDDGTQTINVNNKWSFLLLDMDAICFQAFNGLLFNMTPFRDVGGGHLVKAAFHQVAGQLTISNWGSSALGQGGETY